MNVKLKDCIISIKKKGFNPPVVVTVVAVIFGREGGGWPQNSNLHFLLIN